MSPEVRKSGGPEVLSNNKVRKSGSPEVRKSFSYETLSLTRRFVNCLLSTNNSWPQDFRTSGLPDFRMASKASP